jgi:hypothetical protein
MEFTTLILRVIHIFAGVFWVGAAWIGAFYLGPTAAALGPDGGKFMGHLITVRKYSLSIMIAAVLTILAGLALYALRYGAAGMRTNAGIAFAIGGLFGIAAGVTGGMVGASSSRLVRLGAEIAQQGKPPWPEQQAQMAATQRRIQTMGMATAVLATISLFLMAIARYI